MIIEVEQQSDAWLKCRIGRVTASRMGDVLAMLKRGGESAVRRNYRNEIVTELLTGRASDNYVSPEMLFGIEQEPYARAAYEMERDVMVDQGQFALHDRIPRWGASPDGYVGDDGLIEIKCPATTTHIGYLLAGTVPEDYQPQMLAQMACTGRLWCDFVSFDPRVPERLQLFIRRFLRDESRIEEMEKQVQFFLNEVDEILRTLESVKAIV
jgi:putative phage-type endonuclease